MPLTRRMFAQLVASALLLRHLPALAQTPLTVAVGGHPAPEATQHVVSAGAPADMLLLAVAPEKTGWFFIL
ncbi:iron ABCtransporter periplasmic-binding protein [Citrobacter braakii]|nr:iron ABCtransporter periplasmic-binding protein [Citrobacter braakii]